MKAFICWLIFWLMMYADESEGKRLKKLMCIIGIRMEAEWDPEIIDLQIVADPPSAEIQCPPIDKSQYYPYTKQYIGPTEPDEFPDMNNIFEDLSSEKPDESNFLTKIMCIKGIRAEAKWNPKIIDLQLVADPPWAEITCPPIDKSQYFPYTKKYIGATALLSSTSKLGMFEGFEADKSSSSKPPKDNKPSKSPEHFEQPQPVIEPSQHITPSESLEPTELPKTIESDKPTELPKSIELPKSTKVAKSSELPTYTGSPKPIESDELSEETESHEKTKGSPVPLMRFKHP